MFSLFQGPIGDPAVEGQKGEIGFSGPPVRILTSLCVTEALNYNVKKIGEGIKYSYISFAFSLKKNVSLI